MQDVYNIHSMTIITAECEIFLVNFYKQTNY